MARHADMTPLTPEQSILIAENIVRAQKITAKLRKRYPWLNDEFQSALGAALVDVGRYADPTKGSNFITLGYPRLKGAIIDVLRNQTAKGYRSYPERAPHVGYLEDNACEHGQFFMNSPDKPVGWELELSELIEKWLSRLPKLQAEACRFIYIKGMSKDETAERLQCSRYWLTTLLRGALVKLRRIAMPDLRP